MWRQADRHGVPRIASVNKLDRSSEPAFRTAGRPGLREALRAGVMSLLEPVVGVTVPEADVGAVLGDLAARRGRVTGSVARSPSTAAVTATVPLAELSGYAKRLREPAAQPGRGAGTFRSRPTGYAPVPDRGA